VDELDRLAPAEEKKARIFPAVLLNLKFQKPNRLTPAADDRAGLAGSVAFGASVPMLLQGGYGYGNIL
jgi:hypothetical protein